VLRLPVGIMCDVDGAMLGDVVPCGAVRIGRAVLILKPKRR